jgi:lysophospholipid acyltransferase (LPLAT)-like uncharacterized protein
MPGKDVFPMKINSPALAPVGGFLSALAVRQWMRTLDYRVAYYDSSVDPVQRDCRGQKIYVFWHEYILFPLYLRGGCNLTMLLSRHRDADVLGRAAHHLGFECVRGSTYRGAAAALRELARSSGRLHLTITPDGPRGPRRRLAQGPVYLASTLGLPLVAMGFGYDRPWRVRSWDRFAVPRPFSRARAVVSPHLWIPPNLNRVGMEAYRQRVERLLNELTAVAEAWAATGRRLREARPLRKQMAPRSANGQPPRPSSAAARVSQADVTGGLARGAVSTWRDIA